MYGYLSNYLKMGFVIGMIGTFFILIKRMLYKVIDSKLYELFGR